MAAANEPRPKPSLSPSPSYEEDLTHAKSWDEETDGPENATSTKQKGKQRERDGQPAIPSDESLDFADSGSYPPFNDDEAETRRVQENLRRWEIAERQRRKAARESAVDPAGSSILSDISKLLWSNASQRHSRPPQDRSLGNHTALQSTDSLDTLPLKSVSSPTTPITPTPTISSFPTHQSDNPFSHPADNEQTAVMMPTAEPPTPPAEQLSDAVTSSQPERPTIVASSSSFSKHPPPRPLDLPPPRTPPPRLDISPADSAHPQEEKETRWWHDWLCGCREDGDNQAGRTNPFE